VPCTHRFARGHDLLQDRQGLCERDRPLEGVKWAERRTSPGRGAFLAVPRRPPFHEPDNLDHVARPSWSPRSLRATAAAAVPVPARWQASIRRRPDVPTCVIWTMRTRERAAPLRCRWHATLAKP
jgi:hypothetical protein